MLVQKELNEKISKQLPAGEFLDRVYIAFEGDLRAISVDQQGREYRYQVKVDAENNVSIKCF